MMPIFLFQFSRSFCTDASIKMKVLKSSKIVETCKAVKNIVYRAVAYLNHYFFFFIWIYRKYINKLNFLRLKTILGMPFHIFWGGNVWDYMIIFQILYNKVVSEVSPSQNGLGCEHSRAIVKLISQSQELVQSHIMCNEFASSYKAIKQWKLS